MTDRPHRTGWTMPCIAILVLALAGCASASSAPSANPSSRAPGAAPTVLTTSTSATTTTTTTSTTTTVPASATSETSTSTTMAPTTMPKPATYGSIALVGDSILGMASEQSLPALRVAGWGFITLNAKASRTIPVDSARSPELSGIAAVRHIRATGADPVTWVIELGTNDIGNTGNDGTAMSKLIDKMLAEIGPGHRIMWMTVRQGNNLLSSATFNAALALIAETRSDLVIGDWAAVAATPGYLKDDHIHPTAAGQQAYADLLTATARQLAELPVPVVQPSRAQRRPAITPTTRSTTSMASSTTSSR